MRIVDSDRYIEEIIIASRYLEGHNWYERYTIANALMKEAGWGREISMLIAVALMLAGYGADKILHDQRMKEWGMNENDLRNIETTIKTNNKSNNQQIESILEELQNNPALKENIVRDFQKKEEIRSKKMTAPKQVVPTQVAPVQPTQAAPSSPLPEDPVASQIDIDGLVKAIIQHEGLLPKQTPFRITSPEMKKWTSIHGFKIDRTSPKPKGRENFIFLVNAADVSKAIKKQLSNYATNPSRYGLGDTPSIKDALKVFDQTGVSSKIAFLNKELPDLDIEESLESLFG